MIPVPRGVLTLWGTFAPDFRRLIAVLLKYGRLRCARQSGAGAEIVRGKNRKNKHACLPSRKSGNQSERLPRRSFRGISTLGLISEIVD